MRGMNIDLHNVLIEPASDDTTHIIHDWYIYSKYTHLQVS